MRVLWVGVAAFVAGTAAGSMVAYKYASSMSQPFLSVRLFEFINLALTLSVGTGIAAYYARALSRHGKQLDLTTESVKEIAGQYMKLFDMLDEFMADPTSKTKIVTLQFKSLSAKLATLEGRAEKCKLDKAVLKNLRDGHNALDEAITGIKWGANITKEHFSQDIRDQAKKEMQNIENCLFELRYRVLD